MAARSPLAPTAFSISASATTKDPIARRTAAVWSARSCALTCALPNLTQSPRRIRTRSRPARAARSGPFGFRNPWRFSFDRTTGDMWIGDVGEATAEEMDFQPSNSGGGENYGWPFLEGDR